MVIHRHIGGLEKNSIEESCKNDIHRHIGGLEKTHKYSAAAGAIHRHIGGLEIRSEERRGG